MSQNPEHTPRRALAPPAVTRFQLRTASGTEAVFSPPYVPTPPDPATTARAPTPEPVTPEPFPEPTVRQQPTALPPAVRSRELPRAAPPTRALELPPRDAESQRSEKDRTETDRTEPGTWREIIARFERELGPVVDEMDEAPAAPDATEVTHVADDIGADVAGGRDVMQPVAGPEAELPASERPTPGEPLTPAQAADEDEPSVPDAVEAGEPIQPGEPPFLDEPVPWEIESMTTPDYSPPHSIHDAEHDSWPVDAEDGDAVPAWSDESDEPADGEPAATFDEIGELLLHEVVPADPWDKEPEPDETAPRSDFPLDAFIVPAGVRSVGGVDDDDIARRVALRLDELARGLRDDGLSSLGSAASVDELSRVLAAIVTGYVSRAG